MLSALHRLTTLGNHLAPPKTGGKEAILEKHQDDVVITYAARTPLTKARKGLLKDTPLEELVCALLKIVKDESKIDPALVEDICLGNVLHPAASYAGRTAMLAAGFPVTTACSVASRWCSSGLLATQMIANQILAGSIDCGVAIGAESMSMNPDAGPPKFSDKVLDKQSAQDAQMPMGWTSENVARDFGISREAQDEFAAKSQQKAAAAAQNGWTRDEIVPITTSWKDPKTGEVKTVTADKDEGVRADTTPEGLAKIRSAFPPWGPTTTGGNASQVTDGAAALLLMKRSMAERIGQPILGKFVASTVVALEPRIMGIAPTLAIPKLLQKVNLTLDEVDIVEINEAFSSMGVYCQQKLGLDSSKMNPRGGAVALGHPLACTGARQIVTALSELKRTRKKIAVTSMCVGTGMGMAGLIVSEQ